MPLRNRILISLVLVLMMALSLSCNPNPQPEALTPIPTLAPATTLTLVTELQEPPQAGSEPEAAATDEPSSGPAPAGGDPANGEEIFVANCEVCHGPGAQGGSVGPTLVDAEVAAKDDEHYRQTLLNGVPGTAMAAWGGRLEAQQIEDVIAYLRSLQ